VEKAKDTEAKVEEEEALPAAETRRMTLTLMALNTSAQEAASLPLLA
jgi:hypothetical protein